MLAFCFFEFFLEEFQSVLLDNEVGVKYIFFLAGSSVQFCAGRSGGRAQKNMQKRQVCVSFVD